MSGAKVFPKGFYLKVCVEAEEKADELLKEIRRSSKASTQDVPWLDNEMLDPFLKESFLAVTFGYMAIEAMANELINNLSEDDKKDDLFNQDLSTKLKEGIPRITGKKPLIENGELWNSLKKYEELRHAIVHPKVTDYVDGDNWSKTLISKLLNGQYKKISEWVIKVIDYFRVEHEQREIKLDISSRGLQSKPLIN